MFDPSTMKSSHIKPMYIKKYLGKGWKFGLIRKKGE